MCFNCGTRLKAVSTSPITALTQPLKPDRFKFAFFRQFEVSLQIKLFVVGSGKSELRLVYAHLIKINVD